VVEGGGGGGGGGGRGGPGAGRPGASNLNVSIHYRHSDNSSANPLPALGGQSTISAWDVPVGYSFTKLGMTHSLRFGFNQQRAENTNLFANSLNLAANAGLLGVSTDPFDWGAPNLSFSHIASVRDTNPSTRTDRTVSAGDTITKIHGRADAAIRRRLPEHPRATTAPTRTRAAASCSRASTPATTSRTSCSGSRSRRGVQFNPNPVSFRSTSWDLFVQDDWRATDTVTVNAGCVTNTSRRCRKRTITSRRSTPRPDSRRRLRWRAGGTSPYSGLLPDTIVRPFRAGCRAARRRRLAAGAGHRRAHGIRHQLQLERVSVHRPAACRPVSVRRDQHAARVAGHADPD